ncbi:hypothetical protein CN553_30640 [Bacillus cereus]|uniref:Chitin-binding protein n=1 Tax=Bacillus cereus TaxID=1396 RepID=A0A9X6U5N5_BACCE|nr:hypothetical protein [Bacillus cereus]PEN79387.1 hypothetical protein CN553_30640 [Bacillus cereus]
MKKKQTQMRKGIVLATILGLGWNVAGDRSYAAGHAISHLQKTAEWDAKEGYVKGNTVSYKGTEYELTWGNTIGIKPNKYMYWKTVGGKMPEWNADRGHVEGDTVWIRFPIKEPYIKQRS